MMVFSQGKRTGVYVFYVKSLRINLTTNSEVTLQLFMVQETQTPHSIALWCIMYDCYCYPLQISRIKLGSLNCGWSTTPWQCLLRRTHTWILDVLRPDCQTSSHVEVLCRQSRSWHVSEGSERFISCILLDGFCPFHGCIVALPWVISGST